MKNFKKTALALVVTLVAGYGVYTSQQKSELSELVLANIEALAQNESGDYSQKIWERFYRPDGGYNCTKTGNETCL